MPTAKKDQEYDSYPADYEDLQARQEKGNASDRVLSTADNQPEVEDDELARSYEVEGNDTEAYYGVSPEYATYGNETDAPHAAESGPLQVLEEQKAEMEESFDVPVEDDEDDNEGEPETEPQPEPTPTAAKKTASSSSGSSS